MKITIEKPPEGGEEEIIIRCNDPDSKIIAFIRALKPDAESEDKLTAISRDKGICLLNPEDIYYFESVDDKVFAYCKTDVWELKMKLYELEERLASKGFIRISKSMILNLAKAVRFNPYVGGRFEAILSNGEKALISRQYVQELKKRLGV